MRTEFNTMRTDTLAPRSVPRSELVMFLIDGLVSVQTLVWKCQVSERQNTGSLHTTPKHLAGLTVRSDRPKDTKLVIARVEGRMETVRTN